MPTLEDIARSRAATRQSVVSTGQPALPPRQSDAASGQSGQSKLTAPRLQSHENEQSWNEPSNDLDNEHHQWALARPGGVSDRLSKQVKDIAEELSTATEITVHANVLQTYLKPVADLIGDCRLPFADFMVQHEIGMAGARSPVGYFCTHYLNYVEEEVRWAKIKVAEWHRQQEEEAEACAQRAIEEREAQARAQREAAAIEERRRAVHARALTKAELLRRARGDAEALTQELVALGLFVAVAEVSSSANPREMNIGLRWAGPGWPKVLGTAPAVTGVYTLSVDCVVNLIVEAAVTRYVADYVPLAADDVIASIPADEVEVVPWSDRLDWLEAAIDGGVLELQSTVVSGDRYGGMYWYANGGSYPGYSFYEWLDLLGRESAFDALKRMTRSLPDVQPSTQ